MSSNVLPKSTGIKKRTPSFMSSVKALTCGGGPPLEFRAAQIYTTAVYVVVTCAEGLFVVVCSSRKARKSTFFSLAAAGLLLRYLLCFCERSLGRLKIQHSTAPLSISFSSNFSSLVFAIEVAQCCTVMLLKALLCHHCATSPRKHGELLYTLLSPPFATCGVEFGFFINWLCINFSHVVTIGAHYMINKFYSTSHSR